MNKNKTSYNYKMVFLKIIYLIHMNYKNVQKLSDLAVYYSNDNLYSYTYMLLYDLLFIKLSQLVIINLPM